MKTLKARWYRSSDSRYYETYLEQDLFGQWVLTQVWGRRGTNLGRVVHTPVESYEAGLELLASIEKRRQQHGYLKSHTI